MQRQKPSITVKPPFLCSVCSCLPCRHCYLWVVTDSMLRCTRTHCVLQAQRTWWENWKSFLLTVGKNLKFRDTCRYCFSIHPTGCKETEPLMRKKAEQHTCKNKWHLNKSFTEAGNKKQNICEKRKLNWLVLLVSIKHTVTCKFWSWFKSPR